jgi:hypothetical protein
MLKHRNYYHPQETMACNGTTCLLADLPISVMGATGKLSKA